MKLRHALGSALALSGFFPAAAAPARTSASYRMTTETIEKGGGKLSSARYSAETTISGFTGTSTASGQTLGNGFFSQINEVATFNIFTAPATMNEATARQFNATGALDDGTTFNLSGTEVTWSVVSGPILTLSLAGLATADNVYQNTAAVVRGDYFGKTATSSVTVLNIGTDDFHSYASDQLDDAWQVFHFGQPAPIVNPQFGATGDPDGDGHNNLFEFVGGLTPTDPASRFKLLIEAIPNQPGQKSIRFGPFLTGRNYSVESRVSLSSGMWTSINTAAGDNSSEHTVTDTDASDDTKFYRILISKP